MKVLFECMDGETIIAYKENETEAIIIHIEDNLHVNSNLETLDIDVRLDKEELGLFIKRLKQLYSSLK